MIDLQFQKKDELLKQMIREKTATIAVLGLGYVGLPTAAYYSNLGYNVLGIDISSEKINALHMRNSYIDDITDEQLKQMFNKNFEATADLNRLAEANIIFICVPTPINKAKEPDLTYIEIAGTIISNKVSKGTLIILESTTYPGTTEFYIADPLKAKGFELGKDVFVAYSPERIDPGNEDYRLANTPKIVGGMTELCSELAVAILGRLAHKVSNIRTAELTKVFENTFRWINIAVVNEMAMLCNDLSIDIWEMLDAADTKPYGFMRFEPGIGVGGHCIPVDPYYLTFIMKQKGRRTKMIDISSEINEGMAREVYFRILEIMNEKNKSLRSSNILILGASYKKNIGDIRESPVLKLIDYLIGNVKKVKVIEPLRTVDQHFPVGVHVSRTIDYNDLSKFDLIVIGTPHDCFDYERIAELAPLIFDTKNIYAKHGIHRKNIIKL